MTRVLDNSQYTAFWKCPTYWFTAYVAGVQRERIGQRNDPLCIGSLYHNLMENWYGHRKIMVDPKVIEANNPDKETLDLVMTLGTHYAAKYPLDPWERESIEKAYQVPLIDGWNMVAKVDGVARIDRPTEIDSGIDGRPIVVPAGRYAIEHKTKSGFKPRGVYIDTWRRNKQVDFQQICAGLDGVIVNVAEKPAQRQPTRKCQGCKEIKEFREWTPIEGQRYQCTCGHEQELKPVEIKDKDPEFFRIFQARKPHQLEESKREFVAVARIMQQIIDGDIAPGVNPRSCVDDKYGYHCDYLLDCEELTDPLARPGFVQVENPLEYIGLEE